MSVVIETTMGDFTVDLYIKERPRTCLNFLKLCRIKYYNFCLIHSVQRNFMIQTGDPLGTGRGGESVFSKLYGDQAKYFDAETTPKLKHQKLGTLSMVNNGQNMHGSQFFVTTGEDLDYLDGIHTVFGEVTEGFEVLMKINDAICDEEHRPYKDMRVTHTVILDDPYDDPAGLEIPDRSPEPTEEHLRTDRIGIDEDIDDAKGKNLEEIEEEIKDKEAKARATILEMVGDIPDVEVKPPENVLFVCKLNPVTTDDDLEIIFSRFGPIVSCEVVRDRLSGESLQYAFIEFEKEEDCENAYFKMDNVLIDDRRIHVDFSQSVAKLNYQYKLGKVPPDPKDLPNPEKYQLKKKGFPQGKYQMVFDDEMGDNKKRDGENRHKSDSKRSEQHDKDEDRTRHRRSGSHDRDSRRNRHDKRISDDKDRNKHSYDRREKRRSRSRERRDHRDNRREDSRSRHEKRRHHR